MIARLFDSLALLRVPAVGVLLAGRVTELLREVRQHRLEDPRIDGSRGVEIEIDRPSHIYRPVPRVNAIGVEGASVGGSVETSCSEHVANAARMRSLIRQSGSRTLHFAY